LSRSRHGFTREREEKEKEREKEKEKGKEDYSTTRPSLSSTVLAASCSVAEELFSLSSLSSPPPLSPHIRAGPLGTLWIGIPPM
jgi:hypothetical protein